MNSKKTAKNIIDLTKDRKAENIVLMDMKKTPLMVDYFVLCSASSTTRSRAIAEYVEFEMKKNGERPRSKAGLRQGDWIVLDYFDVVVHIFLDETRSYYQLETLWQDVPQEICS